LKRSKQILVKAITRAEFESLPAVVRFFCPPFDVLAVDHYEPQPEQPPPRYTADELLNYFDRVSLKEQSHRKPHNERKTTQPTQTTASPATPSSAKRDRLEKRKYRRS